MKYTLIVYSVLIMAKQLELLDELVSTGRETFEARDVQELGNLSPQAATNLLSRLVEHGLVDRVARGRYALRPVGVLGTRAASEDIALAVAAAFGRQPHRIAYRSALDFHGLLEHPSRQIIVALAKQTSVKRVSGRPLRPVIELPSRITVGSTPAGHGALVLHGRAGSSRKCCPPGTRWRCFFICVGSSSRTAPRLRSDRQTRTRPGHTRGTSTVGHPCGRTRT